MIILGIDPGTATVGYGFVEIEPGRPPAPRGFGVIRTDKRMAFPDRLAVVHQDMRELLAGDRPDAMAVEELFFLRNTNTAFPVAHARGVILLAAAQCGVPVANYSPAQVKQAIAGHGRADKREVQTHVQSWLGLDALPRPDDAADALAVALTHWQVLVGRGEVAP